MGRKSGEAPEATGTEQTIQNMKTQRFVGWTVLAAAAWLTGCGDSPDTSSYTPPATPPPPPPMTAPAMTAPAMNAATEPAKPAAVEAAKATEAVQTVVDDAAATAQNAAVDASAATQETLTNLVAEVKQLVTDGKHVEALQRVQSSLAGLQLTPEQQKMVDGLKQQIQDAMSKQGVDAAARAAGNLLTPKP